MGKTVFDCALMLQVMAGIDSRDPFTRPVQIPDYSTALSGGVRGFKVGIGPDLFPVPVDPDVQAGYDRVVKALEDAGAELREVRLPHKDLVPPTLLKVFGGEWALWHRVNAHFREITYSPDVARHMEPALASTLDDYLGAQIDRERIRQDYAMVFAEVDLLLGPTQAFPAPRIGQDRITVGGEDCDLLDVIIAHTAPSNLAGIPAISVPAGFSQEGLPVGMQIIAPLFEEARLLRTAQVLEEVLADVHARKPAL
jgi:aspartyl-tRNA(Asn)/glutamyl-tRNA(Gln) amidotransferase subunit A